MKRKYSVELSNLGQFVDRYMACGYNDDYIVAYGDYAEAVRDFCKMMDIELVM